MLVGTGASLAPTGTGSITASALLAGTYANALTLSSASNVFSGSGASLTSLNAGNISSGTLAVARGGTGLSSGTNGGILGFTAAGTIASSGALTANALVVGGGAGATPTVLGSLGTTTTVLHGNASGAPTFGAVNLAADVTGDLPVGNLDGGTGAGGTTYWRGDGTWIAPVLSGTATVGGASVANRACATGTASITGATTAMVAVASPTGSPAWLTGAWNFDARVSAAGTVTVRLCNNTGGALTPASTTFNVRVLR